MIENPLLGCQHRRYFEVYTTLAPESPGLELVKQVCLDCQRTFALYTRPPGPPHH